MCHPLRERRVRELRGQRRGHSRKDQGADSKKHHEESRHLLETQDEDGKYREVRSRKRSDGIGEDVEVCEGGARARL